MKQFISFVIKEAKHILRDKRTMLILFGMPVVMMLLFGFAITTDVKNVRTVVVTSQMDHQTQQAIEQLSQSEYFTITATVGTPQAAERLIRSQQADMAVVFASNFASKKNGLQLIVDGSDPNMAQQWTNYARQVIVNSQLSIINSKMLYNPQMKSAYNFVPAIMGMLLMLICAMMTSISIVREKERSATRLACSPTDCHHSQSRALSGTGFCDSHRHPAHGTLCTRCTTRWLAVLDHHGEHHLYPAGTLTWATHFQRRPDTARGPTSIGYGVAHARGYAFWHDVPCRVHAASTTVDSSRRATTLLYRCHAQTDDYGCGHQ